MGYPDNFFYLTCTMYTMDTRWNHLSTKMILILSPEFKVYMGYIVFVFSVNKICVFVFSFVYKLFCFVKDFSKTYGPRILKLVYTLCMICCIV